jgi:hypothetical protein
MTWVIVDDRLLRDVLTGPASRPRRRHLVAGHDRLVIVPTLQRLGNTRAGPNADGALRAAQQHRFVAQLIALPSHIDVLPQQDVAWPMAELEHRHRPRGRQLSGARDLAPGPLRFVATLR